MHLSGSAVDALLVNVETIEDQKSSSAKVKATSSKSLRDPGRLSELLAGTLGASATIKARGSI